MKLKTAFLLTCFACLTGFTLNAAELTGTVRAVSGDSAEAVLAGDLVPAAGDKATIFFTISGGEDEVVVATASVTAVGDETVQLKMENASGTVAKDQQVRITCANPQKRAAKAPTSPPPPMPPSRVTGDDGVPAPPAVKGNQTALDHFNQAFALNAAGQREGAIAAYSKAIELNPGYAVAYFNRACIYLETGNYEGIIKDTNAALELGYEGKADLYCQRGTGWAGKGDYDKALADHTKAIELNPGHALAYNNRSNDKLRKGDLTGALKDCNQSLALDPNSPLPYYNRGFIHSGLKNGERAVADWIKAVQMRPSYRAELEPHIRRYGGILPGTGEPDTEAVRRK